MLTTITINLNKDFTPFGGYIPNFWSFPDKSIGVKVNEILIKKNIVEIVARLNSSEEIIKLLMLTDAVKREKPWMIKLFIPYLPYARQDRLMVNGESFSLKVIANLINSQEYQEVKVFDPHSNMSGALIEKMVEVKNYKFVKQILSSIGDYVLVAPDFGASKKIYDLGKYLNYTGDVVIANKRRDLSTGKILDTQIIGGDIKNKQCVIT